MHACLQHVVLLLSFRFQPRQERKDPLGLVAALGQEKEQSACQGHVAMHRKMGMTNMIKERDGQAGLTAK